MIPYTAGLWPTWGKPSKIFGFGYKVKEKNRLNCRKSKIPHRHTKAHNSYLCTPHIFFLTTTNNVKGGFSQHAWCAHQVHGGAAWRMWLNKQLRWRLSKVLDLCLCGLQERERERERGELSQSICIKVMGQCVTWQCKQILTQPCLSLRKGGRQQGKGELSQSPLCSPFPPQPAESSKC